MGTRKRGFDPLAVLLGATQGRLLKLLPIKYARMAASPFAFFRGAVAIMAADLARLENTGLFVQLCGDAHVQNLGCFETRFRFIEGTLWRISGKERAKVLHSLELYRKSLPPERLHLFDFFHPVDVAFKVVGTGSVGLRDFVVLMQGNGKRDPLFLQIKQETASAYAPYLKPAAVRHQGRRVAEGQRNMQPLSDLLLGWTQIGEHEYLVRQLNDHKGGIDLTELQGAGLNHLAAVAGQLLARGHARSGDALAITGYLGSPDAVLHALVNYGLEYARVTEADFEAFTKAVKQERIKVAA